jgi:hypothetical protein
MRYHYQMFYTEIRYVQELTNHYKGNSGAELYRTQVMLNLGYNIFRLR